MSNVNSYNSIDDLQKISIYRSKRLNINLFPEDDLWSLGNQTDKAVKQAIRKSTCVPGLPNK